MDFITDWHNLFKVVALRLTVFLFWLLNTLRVLWWILQRLFEFCSVCLVVSEALFLFLWHHVETKLPARQPNYLLRAVSPGLNPVCCSCASIQPKPPRSFLITPVDMCMLISEITLIPCASSLASSPHLSPMSWRSAHAVVVCNEGFGLVSGSIWSGWRMAG